MITPSIYNNRYPSRSASSHIYKPNFSPLKQLHQKYNNQTTHHHIQSKAVNKTHSKQTLQQKIQQLLSKPVFFPQENQQDVLHIKTHNHSPYRHVTSVGIPQFNHFSNKNIQNPYRPPSQSRFQKVPYKRTVYDIQPRQVTQIEYVKVPRQVIDYYTIEYKTEFVPRQHWDTQVQIVPVQKLHYRTQYVLTEKQIISMPDSCSQKQQRQMKQQHHNDIQMKTHFVSSQFSTRRPSISYEPDFHSIQKIHKIQEEKFSQQFQRN